LSCPYYQIFECGEYWSILWRLQQNPCT